MGPPPDFTRGAYASGGDYRLVGACRRSLELTSVCAADAVRSVRVDRDSAAFPFPSLNGVIWLRRTGGHHRRRPLEGRVLGGFAHGP